jgi:arabinofuranan 3-O-arabinosyltransferase
VGRVVRDVHLGRASAARNSWAVASHALLAVAVFLPLLLTERGKVAADSKQLLFVDASRYLARVPWLWDSSVGLGTVTHQNIGYLFPVGPFFWIGTQLGVPVWVTQRLWLGTVLFAAGAGVLFLARTISWRGPGPMVAAFAYALTPFTLQYSTHLSVLLLPYALLGWLIAFTIRTLRAGGWRWPAWFALGIALAGSINATALACVLLGPVIVLVITWIRTRATRRVLGTAGKLALLGTAVSAWWMIALLVEGVYGVNVLDFSESLETVTIASSAPEVLRGLGYWFFYGRDARGPYLDAARPYMVTLLLPISFVPLLAAIVAAWAVRWRARAFLVAMLTVGTVLAVGAHPYRDPSPYGRAFKLVLETFEPAFALRSITRVGPLVVLALAMLLGAGVTALVAHAPGFGRAVAFGGVLLTMVVAWPLYTGHAVSATRVRPQGLPQYWRDAATEREPGAARTRTLELPGIDFAAYDWGYAHDSITPGLTDRPTVAREVVTYGGPGTIDLLQAFDGRIQNRVFDAASVTPIAQLLSAGAVVWRGDLDSERYGLPAPEETRRVLDSTAAALGPARTFGDPVAVARYPVRDPRPLERAEPATGAIVVAGSGDGLVDLAEAGLLPDDRLVVYSGSLTDRPGLARRLQQADATLVLTDTNRRRATRTKTLFGNEGFTERAREEPLRTDTEDSRIDLFPDAGDNARSVTVVDGPTARATSYGNPLWLVPADRPMLALDGDPTTAWRTGDFWRVAGERIEIDTRVPVRTDHVRLLQAPGGNRTITRVRLAFDGGDPVEVDLGDSSRQPPGQTVRFPARRFRTIEVEIVATDPPDRANNLGLTGVGFAEIGVPGVGPAVEYVRLPRDLLDRAGRESARQHLVVVLTRLRQSALPADVVPTETSAAELRLARMFTLPTTRAFDVTGTARPAVNASPSPPEGCRHDVLRVDGSPVGVRFTAASDGSWAVGPCDGQPLTLGKGIHRLLATDGRITGVHLDRLVLTSVPASARAGTTSPAAATRGAPTDTAPAIRVRERGRTSATLRVEGASEPFWLVLGESHNDGWRAEIGGRSLGAPLLVDGYANGWYVEPPRRAFTVTIEWTPQRWIWWGLAISGVALLVCLMLVAVARGPDGRVTAAPEWDDPRRDHRPLASPTAVVATVLGAGVLGTALVGPGAGIVASVAALVLHRARSGRLIVAAGSIGALTAAVAYITLRQWRNDFPADFPWPGSFDAVHRVALVGIALLAVDAVVQRAREPATLEDRS